MSKLKPIPLGAIFGRLTVISQDCPLVGGRTAVTVKCTCGTTKNISQTNLKSGRVNSCGCLNREVATAKAIGNTHRLSHNMSRSPEYRKWDSMLQRCTNKSNPNYERYGAKGISVDPAWLDFAQFYKDMGGLPTTKHTLERLNTKENYSKGNCKWATREEQDDNKLQSIRYEYKGKLQSINELAQLSNVPRQTIYMRLHRHGYSVEQALTEPLGAKPKTKQSATKLKLYGETND